MTDAPDLQVLSPPPPGELRAELEGMLLANILGPEKGDHEELPGNAAVRDYYLVGMLAPRRLTVPPEELDELAVEGAGGVDEATPDISAPTAPVLFPSSLGLTFCVAADTGAVQLEAGWGRYERQ